MDGERGIVQYGETTCFKIQVIQETCCFMRKQNQPWNSYEILQMDLI